ncbi:MAG: group III truncated hemoglobin [Neomegalonema sp.]|nr:group III truncated hemoglobin [Neomegalonema sp.]
MSALTPEQQARLHRSAEERRAQIQAHASSLSIDEAMIDRLVETFYGKIRSHPELAPLFAQRIGDNWPVHLAKMKRFWASVAMHAGTYSGKPVPAHQTLTNVTQAHFGQWLALFEQTLHEVAPDPRAVPYFMERAERIAASLQMAMFGFDYRPQNAT